MVTPEALVRDLENCGVTREKQLEFARKLGIDHSEFWDFVEHNSASPQSGDASYEQLSFCESLADFLNQSSCVERRRVVAHRILFDTLVAINVARSQTKTSHLISTLAAIQQRMEELATLANPTLHDFRDFWAKDGQFHKALCEASSLKSLAWVVDQVISRCFEIGAPKTAVEMKETARQHDRIAIAIFANPLDEDEIFEAVRSHVEQAYSLWFPMERNEYPRDLSNYPAKINEFASDAVRKASTYRHGELSESARARIFAKVQIQFDYPSQFVVYNDTTEASESNDIVPRRIVKGAYPLLASAMQCLTTLREKEEQVTGIQFQAPWED